LSEADPPASAGVPDPSPGSPSYKGAPLDADRGPGLGCFWIQVGLLVFLLIATPVSVWLAMPPWVSAAFLILVLILLFFVGQTSIFLLRLVAADRRAERRVPRSSEARKTVGMLEDEAAGSSDAVPLEDEQPSNEDDARPR
jgi:hypothetical protein